MQTNVLILSMTLMMFDFYGSKLIFISKIDFERNNFFLFFVKIIFKKILNINYFILKLILTKSILIKLILSKINFIKTKINTCESGLLMLL